MLILIILTEMGLAISKRSRGWLNMFGPIIDYNAKCVKCGASITHTGKDVVTYSYVKTGEEVVVRRCSCCGTKLAIPIRSKGISYERKSTDSLYPVLH